MKTERQLTIKKRVSVSGTGLHRGEPVTVTFYPAPPGSGISIKNNGETYALGPDKVSGVKRGTTISCGKSVVHTVEHMMAAVGGMRIDNLEIEISGNEAPLLDGSSRGFISALRSAGLKTQVRAKKYFTPAGPALIKDGDAFMAVIPYKGFRVYYYSDFSARKIKPGAVFYDGSRPGFEKGLAGARTFGFSEELGWLLKSGLIKGAVYKNAVLIKDGKPVKTKLRFSDELTRHKALDVVGDFSLLGANLNMLVIAVKTGHRHNINMIRELLKGKV